MRIPGRCLLCNNISLEITDIDAKDSHYIWEMRATDISEDDVTIVITCSNCKERYALYFRDADEDNNVYEGWDIYIFSEKKTYDEDEYFNMIGD